MISAAHQISVEPPQEGSQKEASCRLVCTWRHGLAYVPIVFNQLEQFCRHLEADHHVPVPRAGETEAQAVQRFIARHPEARDCSQCAAAGAPWSSRMGWYQERTR